MYGKEHVDPSDASAYDEDGNLIRGSTWRAIDLRPYIFGQVKRPEPDIGIARADGLRLLYLSSAAVRCSGTCRRTNVQVSGFGGGDAAGIA